MGKVTWFLADSKNEWNTSGHRVQTPSKRLARAGHYCFVSHVREIISGSLSTETKKAVDECSAVIIERLLVAETHQFIKDCRDKGKLVVATFDDDYSLIPGTVSRNTWRGGKKAQQGKGDIRGQFWDGLRIVDKFMTPSQLLCDDFGMYNPNAEYVPNYLDEDIWSNLPGRNPDLVSLGYGGTSLHASSWKDSGIIPALGSLCAKYPKVQVVLQTPYPDVVDALKKVRARFITGNWVPFNEWPKYVAKFNIGLGPLDGKRYDSHRSNLKCLEYATARVPWVATNDAPYKDCRGGILTENRSASWERALEEILSDIRGDNHYAEEGLAWAKEFNSGCAKRYEEVLEL